MRLVCQDSERHQPAPDRLSSDRPAINRQVALAALRQRFIPAARPSASSLATSCGLDTHAFPHHALCAGTLHEVLSDPVPAHTLLTHLAHAIVTGDNQSRPLLWIGQCTWPYLVGLTRPLLSRSVFLRPLTVPERLWAIDLAIRSRCVSGIVADGSAFDLACTRRLFLSAESAAITCLLARPSRESNVPTAASTRWHITPHPSPHHTQRWQVRLLRCKSNLTVSTAPTNHTWIIEHAHSITSTNSSNPQTGTLRVVAQFRDRSDMATTAPQQSARIL